MSEKNCGYHQETLWEYAAGKLDSAAAADVERHLEICPACRELAEGQRAVWMALDAWEAPPVSAGFDRRLFAQLEAETGWRDRLARLLRSAWLRRGGPILAAACLALVGVIVLYRPARTPSPPPAQAVQMEPLRPDQLEGAVQDMESLQEFDGMLQPEPGKREM